MQFYIPIPVSAERSVTAILVYRCPDDPDNTGHPKSDSAEVIATLPLLDDSGNYITSWKDGEAASEGWWYQARFNDGASDVWTGYAEPNDIYGVRMTGQWTQGIEETLISPGDVREMVRGLDLGNTADWTIQKMILRSQAAIETWIRSKLVSTLAEREAHDGTNRNMLRLYHWPLLEILELEVKYPNLIGTRTYNPEWIKPLNMERGTIRIMTLQAANAFIVQRGTLPFQPAWNVFPGDPQTLPQTVYCSYRHGWSGLRVFQPEDAGETPRTVTLELPHDLREAWVKRATIEALQVTGDAKGGGVASQSIDGLSVSYTASATTHIYSARIKSYTDDIKALLEPYTRYFFSFA